MLRIPGSINSKNGEKVRIVNIWNGYKPRINYLLSEFCRYLANLNAQKYRSMNRSLKSKSKNYDHNDHNNSSNYTLNWIEKLLKTPIADFRKYCVWRVLVPYLINRRKTTEDQCTNIIIGWLEKCSKLSRIVFQANSTIRYNIKRVASYGPAHPDKIKQELPVFYDLLREKRILL